MIGTISLTLWVIGLVLLFLSLFIKGKIITWVAIGCIILPFLIPLLSNII